VTVVLPPKTELQFKNTDPFTHRLYGVNIKSFSAADTTGKGGVRKWQVPEPGTFEIRDEAAPSLRMWVVAANDVAAIAYPSMDGKFLLTVPEPGEYRLQAYFAGKKVGSERPVDLTRRDAILTGAPLVVATKSKDEKK
jgi:hypothetical protein